MENSTVYKSNKKHYDKLQMELSKLEQNMKKLEGNMKTTLEQIPSIRQLGTLHSSLFMSAHSVLNKNKTENNSS